MRGRSAKMYVFVTHWDLSWRRRATSRTQLQLLHDRGSERDIRPPSLHDGLRGISGEAVHVRDELLRKRLHLHAEKAVGEALLLVITIPSSLQW